MDDITIPASGQIKSSIPLPEKPQFGWSRNQVRKLKREARGRWREILHHVGGLPLEILDGRWHDCPKCGGKKTFRFVSNETGEVECRVCHPSSIKRN